MQRTSERAATRSSFLTGMRCSHHSNQRCQRGEAQLLAALPGSSASSARSLCRAARRRQASSRWRPHDDCRHPALFVTGAADGEATTTTTTEQQLDPAKAALLARIAKAKAYKQGGAPSDSSGSGSAPAASAPPAAPPPSLQPQQRPVTDWGAMAAFLESGGRSGGSAGDAAPPYGRSTPSGAEQQLTADQREVLEQVQRLRAKRFEAAKDKMSEELSPIDSDLTEITAMLLNATQSPERGSATQPAPFLRAVLNDDQQATSGLDSNMRMEEFTLAKEQRIKLMGAEILTVDPTYRAQEDGLVGSGEIVSTSRTTAEAAQALGLQGPPAPPALDDSSLAPSEQQQQQPSPGEEDEAYRPKVSTWGVFPRPRDISKEYGGGRDLKPGQEIETKEQKAARELAYRQALLAYKSKVGLEVDEEAEEEAGRLYEEGMALFAKADLQGSYDTFQKVMDLVPLKSKFGGLAGLQAAIILDSTGNSDKAQKLYKQLRGHAVAQVARKAKQMLFGFTAAQFLKADTMSYAARKGDFDRYFRPLADRTKIYVQSEEERLADERAAQVASLVALAVILAPVLLVAALANK